MRICRAWYYNITRSSTKLPQQSLVWNCEETLLGRTWHASSILAIISAHNENPLLVSSVWIWFTRRWLKEFMHTSLCIVNVHQFVCLINKLFFSQSRVQRLLNKVKRQLPTPFHRSVGWVLVLVNATDFCLCNSNWHCLTTFRTFTILAKVHNKQTFIDMVHQHGISIVAVFIIRATISLSID